MIKLRNKKFKLILIILLIFVALILMSIFNDQSQQFNYTTNKLVHNLEPFECHLNDQKLSNESCFYKQNDSSIYIKFDLIKTKFRLDIAAEFINNKQGFQISSSDFSKVHQPQIDTNYNCNQSYLWFSDHFVEARDRVKYTSLKYGVPISSQWKPSGHLYPIQIAQYGLSHYSKWFEKVTKNENMKPNYKLQNVAVGDFIKKIKDGISFNLDNESILPLPRGDFLLNYLTVDRLLTNSSFQINIYLTTNIKIIYEFNLKKNNKMEESDELVQTNNENLIIYSLFLKQNELYSFKLIRNICIDICKVLKTIIKCSQCINNHQLIVSKMTIKGQGKLVNTTFRQDPPHLEISKQTADFLLNKQNKTTGYLITIISF
jgi:heparosan-N-sulfate-glucuronate 5-epimerase